MPRRGRRGTGRPCGRFVRGLATATILAVGGCATGSIPTRESRDVPAAAASFEAASETTPGGLDAATARAETERILAEVARARNLAVKGPVKVEVISKAGIRAFAKNQMYEDTPPERLRLLGRIESSLGVLPIGADPERVLLDLLEEGVLGLYDPKTETLHIGDFVPKPMLSMVVGHEIAHGLQDMHFDLKSKQKPMWHESDAESARRFLIEGEAQAAYLAWVAGDSGLESIDDGVLQAMGDQALELAGDLSPYPVLARSLQMPYADGTATVIRLVLRKGWNAVDALYDDLPRTTEQMLHIDKLLSREPARPVWLDEAPLARTLGLVSVWHDTLGEAGLLAMLAQVEGATAARRAAAGWGGDRYLAFDDPERPLAAPVVVAATVWDSEHDAAEFETSLRRYLEQIEGRSLVARNKDRVVFATQIPPSILEADLEAAAWKAFSTRPPRTASNETGDRP